MRYIIVIVDSATSISRIHFEVIDNAIRERRRDEKGAKLGEKKEEKRTGVPRKSRERNKR